MDIIVTTCCKEKDMSSQFLPAIARYKSIRIEKISTISIEAKKELFFLSGKFGIIHKQTPIPWYDKRLLTNEVTLLKALVKFQLNNYDIKRIDFYARDRQIDGWEPYYQVLENACKELNIVLTIYIIDY